MRENNNFTSVKLCYFKYSLRLILFIAFGSQLMHCPIIRVSLHLTNAYLFAQIMTPYHYGEYLHNDNPIYYLLFFFNLVLSLPKDSLNAITLHVLFFF